MIRHIKPADPLWKPAGFGTDLLLNSFHLCLHNGKILTALQLVMCEIALEEKSHMMVIM